MKSFVLVNLFILLFLSLFSQENVYFRDDFGDNTYKWEYDPNRQLNAYIEDSCLYINNLSSIEAPARYVRNLFLCNDSNFVIETKLAFLNYDVEQTAGLIWHSRDNHNGFYFQITNTGKVRIWGNKHNLSLDYLAWTDFPAFKNVDGLVLRIEKNAQNMNFFVNNILVLSSPYRGQYGYEMGFTIGKFADIKIDYIEVVHPPIKESDKKIAEKLKPDDLFWLIQEEKYKQQISIFGKVFDLNTGGVLRSASVFVLDTLGNELMTTQTNEMGEFSVLTKFAERILIKSKTNNYLSNAQEFNFSINDESFERKFDFHLQKIEVGKTIVLKNVLFPQGKSELLIESYFELNKLVDMMKENPNMEIELSGHTDNSGSAEKNYILSEERVESVKQYLVNKGISLSRITGKGYGGDFPVTSNDNDLTRHLNRRVEFKIVKN